MSLPLPRLDDRTYADLVEEARALIPALYPAWTDHNPSDPGITLIELFAWLTEMLIYRVDQISDEQHRVFLKLLNGAHWTGSGDLEEDVRATVAALRGRYRAVTAEDYERLAREAAEEDVARAWCVPRRNLEAATKTERRAEAPGHMSLIVLPEPQERLPGQVPQPLEPLPALLETVWEHLEPRRLLTTRHHVVGPVYTPVQAEILLAHRSDATPSDVSGRVAATLWSFLHPLEGGPEGTGWPLGRDVYVSEIYELLKDVEGIDYVADVALESQCPDGASWSCVLAGILWHESGDQIGLGLEAYHLPWGLLDPAAVVSAANLVTVRLTIPVTPASGVAPRDARIAVKSKVRRLFHPLYGRSPQDAAWETSLADVGKILAEDLYEVASVGTITAVDAFGRPFGSGVVRLEQGQLADVVTHVQTPETV